MTDDKQDDNYDDNTKDPSDFTGGSTKQDEQKDQTNDITETAAEPGTETVTETDELDGSELEPEESKSETWDIRGKLSRAIPGGGNGGNGGDGAPYDDDGGVDDPSKRKLGYAILGFGAGAAAFLGLDGVDGEWDGNYEIFSGFAPQEQPQNETGQPQNETGQPQNETGQPQNETGQEPVGQTPTGDDIYFEDLNDLPEGACYREDGGVSGYFDASDIEDALGQEATDGLTPSQGDIAYDVDFRDTDGDGRGDSYVMQLAGTDSQNDLTVEQARTLFSELDVDGSYC